MIIHSQEVTDMEIAIETDIDGDPLDIKDRAGYTIK